MRRPARRARSNPPCGRNDLIGSWSGQSTGGEPGGAHCWLRHWIDDAGAESVRERLRRLGPVDRRLRRQAARPRRRCRRPDSDGHSHLPRQPVQALDGGGIFPGRSEVPKPLIFATDDSHADDIVRICREESGRGDDFAAKITYLATGVKPDGDPARRLSAIGERGAFREGRGADRYRVIQRGFRVAADRGAPPTSVLPPRTCWARPAARVPNQQTGMDPRPRVDRRKLGPRPF